MKFKGLLLLWLFAALVVPVSGAAADYQIGEGDTLDIAVWGVKELNYTVKVRPDGKITVPGLGDVVAGGATPVELQAHLAERLKDLVKSPIVTVTVKEITNSKVYVFGAGVKSGVLDLSRRTTLLQLLCNLPDVKNADLRKGYLLREGKKVTVDLHRLFIGGELDQDLPLRSGDSIFIPLLTDKSVYVLGAVNAPKAIEYREGMKVMEAILESGGFNKFADQDGVQVRRKSGSEEVSIDVKAGRLLKEGDLGQNVELKAGDFVLVRESFF